MKAILEFTLPEDQAQYDMASMSYGMWKALRDFDNYMREQIKYKKKPDTLEMARQELYDIMDSNDVDLNRIP